MNKFSVALMVSVLVLELSSAAVAQDKPNIVLVFMDNFGWGEPGFNGGGIIRGAPTPRLDKLANEGLRLTNFNVEVQCTPSRSAIMTGRYAIRSGNGTVPLGEGVYGLVQWEVTMAEMLSKAGYAMDLFPTFAKIAGGEVPDDRIIDGVDMTDFFLGKRDKSGREGFVVYMGNDVFGVKWRNWKLHFKEQDSAFDQLRTYTMPRVYNLLTDPQERDNVLFPATWVPKAALAQLSEHSASLKNHPPIPTGTLDPYQPPK